jgi:hypothetical protein
LGHAGLRVAANLAQELVMSLEDERERFTVLGIDIDGFAGQDAPMILRVSAGSSASQGKQLFLLIDEAEVLIAIARTEPAGWRGCAGRCKTTHCAR